MGRKSRMAEVTEGLKHVEQKCLVVTAPLGGAAAVTVQHAVHDEVTEKRWGRWGRLLCGLLLL